MQWFWQNGFTLLQTVSIVASLLFTAFTVRADIRERRIANLFLLTSGQREIWNTFYEKPELSRIFEAASDLDPLPTLDEKIFVRSLILHLAASFRARSYGMYFQEAGLAPDVRQFFSKPIPQAVWEEVRKYQEVDFARFIDSEIATQTANVD